MAIRLAAKNEIPYCKKAEPGHDPKMALFFRHYKPSILIDTDAPQREREARLGKIPERMLNLEAHLIEIIARHASSMRYPLRTIGANARSRCIDQAHAENDTAPAWTGSEIEGKYAGMQKTGKEMLELLEREIGIDALLDIAGKPGARAGYDRSVKTDRSLCEISPDAARLKELCKKMHELAGRLITFAQATSSMGAARKIMTQVALLSYYCGLCGRIEEGDLKGYFEYSDEIKRRKSRSASLFAGNLELKRIEETYRPMWKAGIYG